MKKLFPQIRFAAGLFVVALLLLNCKGDDGDPGPAGPTGAKGDKGDTGSTGATGVGFDDAVKYGDITVTFDGKRPDGVAFTKTLDFKFASSNLDYSSIDATDPNNQYSELRRFLSLDNTDNYNGNDDDNVYIEFNNSIVDGVTTPYIYLDLHSYITTDDFKYFRLTGYYYNGDGSNFTNFSVTDYSYNASTGKLFYKFSFTGDHNYNSTGYDLKISGTVNVTVFQRIYDNSDKKGPKLPFVEKAVMMEVK
jgi:hypothetical protein